jgi:shikimate kinase
MAKMLDSKANIVLTGFMGTGKTTIGRLLAAQLGIEFVDTDAVVTARYGPIANIFARQGECAFRRMEREVALELGRRSGLVIATGGGMLLDARNAAILGATGRIFCLTATPQTILNRVAVAEGERPLLAGPDPASRIAALLAERAAAYDQFTQIATDGRSPADIAAEIITDL